MSRERGSAAVEWVLLVPVVVLLLGAVVVGARVAGARQQVAQAAGAGARAATLERSAAGADAAARAAAAAGLSTCRTREVAVDVGGFRVPVGQPAVVRVSATCEVALDDLGLPVPGSVTLRASHEAALDRYRGRR